MLTAIAIDDEPIALEIIQRHAANISFIDIRETFTNAFLAAAWLQKEKVDLIFLDIKMPKLLGTDFIRSLPDPPKIILITAYREYAMDGYELDIVDYLLKPVSFSRFMKAVVKAGKLLSSEGMQLSPGTESNEPKNPFIYFRIDKEMVKVFLQDILFIESRKEFVKLYMENNRSLLVKQSITSMERLLSPHRFIRAHRSYIVTVGKIRSFNSTHIMIGEHKIPIGRLYKNSVDEILKL